MVGATDVRLIKGSWDNFESLKSRIMVAGGGGGISYYDNQGYLIGTGGHAGGINAFDGDYVIVRDDTSKWYNKTLPALGGSQTLGGRGGKTNTNENEAIYFGESGSFGKGGKSGSSLDPTGAGGGSGYYGRRRNW